MKQFIRTNDEGNKVLDYDLLDTGARANFIEAAHRWASEITVDVESEPDASNAEKVEAIDTQADMTVKSTLTYLYDDEENSVEIDAETQQMIIDIIANDLAKRYEVQL